MERVYHTAAKVSTVEGSEREIYDTNVVGTRNVLKAAREAGARRVVVTGSLSAVGNNPDRPANEDDAFYPFDWHLPYGRSKAWVEHECLKAAALGQEVVIAVSCAILGPNDFIPSRMGRVVQDFAERARCAPTSPAGSTSWPRATSWQGHVLAMEKGKVGQRYIFSTALRRGGRADGHPRARHRPPAARGSASRPA